MEESDEANTTSTPESAGFSYATTQSGESSLGTEEEEDDDDQEAARVSDEPERPSSRESFTRRFRRYVRRILPGGSRNRSEQEEEEDNEYERERGRASSNASSSSSRNRFLNIGRKSVSGTMVRPEDVDIEEPEYFDDGSFRHQRHQRRPSGSSSGELSRERTASEPFNHNTVYEHRHRHKHDHPGSHHHHEHSPNHVHTYHVHAGRRRDGSESSGHRGGNVIYNDDAELDNVDSDLGHSMESSSRAEESAEPEMPIQPRSSSRRRQSDSSNRSNRSTNSRRSQGRSSRG